MPGFGQDNGSIVWVSRVGPSHCAILDTQQPEQIS